MYDYSKQLPWETAEEYAERMAGYQEALDHVLAIERLQEEGIA